MSTTSNSRRHYAIGGVLLFSTATGGERSYADLAVVSHAYLLEVPDTADVITGDCAPPLRVYNR